MPEIDGNVSEIRRCSSSERLVTLFGQAADPDGCIPVARIGLVVQADCHLTLSARRHQTTSVDFLDFSRITH
jgi:hypothetical protein